MRLHTSVTDLYQHICLELHVDDAQGNNYCDNNTIFGVLLVTNNKQQLQLESS